MTINLKFSIFKYFLLLLLGLMVMPGALGSVWAILFIFYSLTRGRLGCVLAMLTYLSAIILNPHVFSVPSLPTLNLLIFAFVLVRYGRFKSRDDLAIIRLMLIVFALVCLSSAIVYGFDWQVSMLKLTMFFFGISALLTLLKESVKLQTNLFLEPLFTLLAMLAVMSIPTYFMYAGFAINGRGFQGAMNHPQGFALAMGSLFMLCYYRIISKASPHFWLNLGFMCLSFVFLVLSQSRTSIFALLLSLFLAEIIGYYRGGKMLFVGRIALNKYVFIGFVFAIGLALLNADKVKSLSEGILQKGSDAGNVQEAFAESRGFLFQAALRNFRENKWFGIGFQVSNGKYGGYTMKVSRDPFFGIPIGASIEKGFLPMAMLEEIGLVGGGLFILILIKLFLTGIGGQGYYAVSLFFFSIFVNFGEAVLFSLSGYGLLIWLLISTFVSAGLISRRNPQ